MSNTSEHLSEIDWTGFSQIYDTISVAAAYLFCGRNKPEIMKVFPSLLEFETGAQWELQSVECYSIWAIVQVTNWRDQILKGYDLQNTIAKICKFVLKLEILFIMKIIN